MILENEILSAVYSEGRYNEVSFLEPKDFMNPINEVLWKLIQSCKGDLVDLFTRISDLERVQWANAVKVVCLGSSLYRLPQMGLKLVELRFEKLLQLLLIDLIQKSENPFEKIALKQVQEVVKKEHILDLYKGAFEYIESKAGDGVSTYTRERFESFENYITNRLETIRAITNEHK